MSSIPESILEEDQFQAAPFHSQSVFSVKHDVLGDADENFNQFFTKLPKPVPEVRLIWMKIYFVPASGAGDADERGSSGGYHFLAFDPLDGSTWYEHQTSIDAVFKKVEEYNPGTEMEEDALIKHVTDAISDNNKTVQWRFATKSVMAPKALLPSKVMGYFSFRKTIGKSGITFDYKFDCTRTTAQRNAHGKDLAFMHLVQPFQMILNHVLESEAQLMDVIEKKDREIEDYKFQGATVSRAGLATPHFEREEFTRSRAKNMKVAASEDVTDVSNILKLYNSATAAHLRSRTEELDRSKKKKAAPTPEVPSPKRNKSPVKPEKVPESSGSPSQHRTPAASSSKAAKKTPPRTEEAAKPPAKPVKKRRGFM